MWRMFLVGIALALVIAFGVVSFSERITLVADAPIQVMDRAITDPQQTKAIGSIDQGEEVPVLGCEDLKHYIAPEIKLADGKAGYVLVGQFQLKRHSPWSLSPPKGAPLVFSC